MWVLTPYGYTSAVQHKRKPFHVMVRARDELSLQNFCKFAGVPQNLIYSDFPSDYPFRVVVKKRTYKKFLMASVDDIDYVNFKTRAGQVRPAYIGGEWKKGKLKGGTATGDNYVSVLHSIWSVTHGLTPRKVKNENDKAWARQVTAVNGRWGTGGAWASYGAPKAPTTESESLFATPAFSDIAWPDATDLLDMEETERNAVLADLELAKREGDEDAGDVLADWDAMDMDVPISQMTDAEFARFENGEFSV